MKLIYPERFHLGKKFYIDTECSVHDLSDPHIVYSKVNPNNRGWITHTSVSQRKTHKFGTTNTYVNHEKISRMMYEAVKVNSK